MAIYKKVTVPCGLWTPGYGGHGRKRFTHFDQTGRASYAMALFNYYDNTALHDPSVLVILRCAVRLIVVRALTRLRVGRSAAAAVP
jgi:hypothetical protein